VLLFYSKSKEWAWNPQVTDYSEDYVRARFKHVDANGRYKDADLTAAKPGGDTSYQWRVKRVADGTWTHDLEDEWESPHEGAKYRAVRPSSGRYWAYSRANMTAFAKADRLHKNAPRIPTSTSRRLRGTLLIGMIGASWRYPSQCVETPHD